MLTTSQPTTRQKSPDRLLRDKALERWIGFESTSPVPRKFPPGLAGTLADAAGLPRQKVYRWLADPERHRLTWDQLQAVATELGGSVRVMFSIKHP